MADPTLGAGDDLERTVQALRDKYPDVLICVSADSGYGKPWFYRICERPDVEYSIDIGRNNVLKRNTEELLQNAVEKLKQPLDRKALYQL